jgi:hypothetical protein
MTKEMLNQIKSLLGSNSFSTTITAGSSTNNTTTTMGNATTTKNSSAISIVDNDLD